MTLMITVLIENDPETFIEYSQYMGNIYNNINDYNPNRERTILIVFDHIVTDIMTNKELDAGN